MASDQHPAALSIVVNGEARPWVAGGTLLDLLTELERDPRTVAVEYNGEILPRPRYAETVLHDQDRLEIVHFVQGGCQRRVAFDIVAGSESCDQWAASSIGRATDS